MFEGPLLAYAANVVVGEQPMAQALASVAAIVATFASLIVLALGFFVASLAFRNALALSRSRRLATTRAVNGDRYQGVARRGPDGREF